MTVTTYTSSITVPVYASWRCPYCDEINSSEGSIKYQSNSNSEKRAERKTQQNWQLYAYNIIFSPKEHPSSFRDSLTLKNLECTKCAKNPQWKWIASQRRDTFQIISAVFMVMFGLVTISAIMSQATTSALILILFVASLGSFLLILKKKVKYTKDLKNMSDKYMPVIGSLNQDLKTFTINQGRSLPTFEETVEIVKRR